MGTRSWSDEKQRTTMPISFLSFSLISSTVSSTTKFKNGSKPGVSEGDDGQKVQCPMRSCEMFVVRIHSHPRVPD
jgi:hypothetical protein